MGYFKLIVLLSSLQIKILIFCFMHFFALNLSKQNFISLWCVYNMG